MTNTTTRQTAYNIHLANQLGNILPSRLKAAFQHSNGYDFQLADQLTLREMLQAAYLSGSAYEPAGKGVHMKDEIQATERFLNLGLIPSSFA
jgi:hypothetical protein